MNLTKDFSMSEFWCPCCKSINMSPIFMKNLQELRDIYAQPMVINSGYRCKSHNSKVGGVENSKHLSGIAADIAVHDAHSRYRLVQIALRLGFKGIGIYKSFIHLDTRAADPVIWTG